MLYAVMMRLDSLREIKASLFANVNRFNHLGLKHFPCRSTLSDANKRRDSEIFGSIYMNLYEKYRHELYSDSRNCGQPKWLKNLKIIDSTLNSAAFFLVRRFYVLRCLFGALYAVMRFFGASWVLSGHKIPHPNQWGI